MATKNSNERAWTPQDVKALECAMLNKLEIGFTSIDNDEIPNPNKLSLDAKPTDFWGRKLELEKSIFINSSILTKEMVSKVENAKENDETPRSIRVFGQWLGSEGPSQESLQQSQLCL